VISVPPTRSYDDPCGIARALDIVGDRWALLVVRELVFGPKRFRALRAGLGDISPNVLSQRLRDLEIAGLVAHELLDPPAAVAIYGLTDRGQALEPILIELGRWGSREPMRSANELSANAFLLALKTVFDPAQAIDATFALGIADEWFVVTTRATTIDGPSSIDGPSAIDRPGSITIAAGRTDSAGVSLIGDIATLRALAFGRESVTSARRAKRLQIEGDPTLAARFSSMFAVPPR
jgi:DNA-binding HxlR family transcriptional regulator